VLDERPTHTARRSASWRSSRTICRMNTRPDLEEVVNWGRYGELFAYDETSETFSLENPQ